MMFMRMIGCLSLSLGVTTDLCTRYCENLSSLSKLSVTPFILLTEFL